MHDGLLSTGGDQDPARADDAKDWGGKSPKERDARPGTTYKQT